MIEMFPGTKVDTESVSVYVHLFVNVPPDKVTDKVILAAAAREWLAELLDDDNPEYEPSEVFADRISTSLEVVRDHYLGLQSGVPLQIRDFTADLLAKRNAELDEEERFNIVRLEFGTTHYPNGYFFDDQPDLVHVDADGKEATYTWDDVFGYGVDVDNLSNLPGALSEAFGPLDKDGGLSLDMATGDADPDE